MIEALADAMLWRGIPENIQSDKGPEFAAKDLGMGLANVGDRDAVYRTRCQTLLNPVELWCFRGYKIDYTKGEYKANYSMEGEISKSWGG